MRQLTHMSLFSGVGGIDIAADEAGFETVGQVEMAAYPFRYPKQKVA
jgi:DNA (cytosine-5)-methyltransferase 1